jgi:hypothetical protein
MITKEGNPRASECADWEKDMKLEVLSGEENILTSEAKEELSNVVLEEGYFDLHSRNIKQLAV